MSDLGPPDELCPKCGAYVMASDEAEAKWRALAARLAEAERLLSNMLRCLSHECGVRYERETLAETERFLRPAVNEKEPHRE